MAALRLPAPAAASQDASRVFLPESSLLTVDSALDATICQPHDRTAAVLAKIKSLVRHCVAGEQQLSLLRTAVEGLEIQVAEEPALMFPFIHLAPLAYAGISGDEPPIAHDLAAITALVFLGLDIMDDLADGDRPAHWNDWRPAEINLAAATLLCAIVPKAISQLRVPPELRDRLQRTLADGLARMSSGQLADLTNANSEDVSVEEIEISVAAKSGEEFGVFGALGAQLAGGSADNVELYAEAGRQIGIAGQLASDCFDIFNDPASRDLAHGTRTLPIVMHLERLETGKRAHFLHLLDRARIDEIARAQVREEVRPRVIRHCSFLVEVHCQRARRAIDQAAPLEPARSALLDMAAQMSFFRQQNQHERQPNE